MWGQILVSTKGPTYKLNYMGLVLSSLPKFSPVDTARALLDPPLLILHRMFSTLKSAFALTALWQCQRCNCTNNSAKSKRRCFSCRAWRDGIAPPSVAGIMIPDAHGGGGASFCSSKNDAPNNASPRKVGSPKKRGGKRKSLSRGLVGMALHPLPPPSPPPLWLTCSITPESISPQTMNTDMVEWFFGNA